MAFFDFTEDGKDTLTPQRHVQRGWKLLLCLTFSDAKGMNKRRELWPFLGFVEEGKDTLTARRQRS